MNDLDTMLTDEEIDEYNDMKPSRGRISYSNASLDIAGLVRRMDKGDIVIPQLGDSSLKNLEVNLFQRGFVWNRRQMDSFVESMLLGYPTPSLFLVNQSDGRMLVLDGQQRLVTLRMFYSGLYSDKVYKLNLAGSQFDGYSYTSLEADSRRFLDNTYLSATIIRLEDSSHAADAVYDVFARLNSGGTKLTPHEIRIALYNGPLMETIDRLNRAPEWRFLYGSEPNKRFRDHELILRILALFLDGEEYKKPLGSFLNKFAQNHRNDNDKSVGISEACRLFHKTATYYKNLNNPMLFSTTERRQINSSKVDSLMVGLMKHLKQGLPVSEEKLSRALETLTASEIYSDAIMKATSDEQSVSSRIHEVMRVLSNV